MNRMRTVIMTAVAAIAATGLGAQAPQGAEQELDRLRGSFSMVSGQADGQEMPAMMVGSMKRVAAGNETTVTMAGQLYMKATFSINAGASPKTIDYAMTGGFTAGKRQLGIYRTSGDTVTFCFGSPGQSRPREFASKQGSGITCSVWKREKTDK